MEAAANAIMSVSPVPPHDLLASSSLAHHGVRNRNQQSSKVYHSFPLRCDVLMPFLSFVQVNWTDLSPSDDLSQSEPTAILVHNNVLQPAPLPPTSHRDVLRNGQDDSLSSSVVVITPSGPQAPGSLHVSATTHSTVSSAFQVPPTAVVDADTTTTVEPSTMLREKLHPSPSSTSTSFEPSSVKDRTAISHSPTPSQSAFPPAVVGDSSQVEEDMAVEVQEVRDCPHFASVHFQRIAPSL